MANGDRCSKLLVLPLRDDVYLLIAAGRIYVDLTGTPLVEPADVQVYPDRDSAFRRETEQPHLLRYHSLLPPFQSLREGAVVTWDGRTWRVANIGDSTVALLNEGGRLLELPQVALESLMESGQISQSDPSEPVHGISDRLLHAGEEDLKTANSRASIE
jgi:hypothetical protein